MQGNWKIGSNDSDVAKVSIPSLVCVEAAHNPAAAGPRVQIPPPQPNLTGRRQLIAFTSFKIPKEAFTSACPTMLRAGLNNITSGNHVGRRGVIPGQLSGNVRSYRGLMKGNWKIG